jgi:hypothetical protein
MTDTNKIITIGYIRAEKTNSEHIHLNDYVYSEEGICRTTCARDYKDPIRILINRENHIGK